MSGGASPSASARPVLSVGITGHRLDKLVEADLAPLRNRLVDLLARLDAAMLRLGGSNSGEAPQCRLVSALAEGADRLTVDAAPSHWPLVALLPMPRALYREDFLSKGQETNPSAMAFDAYLARAETVSELPMVGPHAGPRERIAQYAALGHALVRQINCLVAVWDGKPAGGLGGTADVIAEAVELGLPVLWLEPQGATPPRQILSFRNGDLTRPDLGPADDASLCDILERISRRPSGE